MINNKVRKIGSNRLKLAEYTRNVYAVYSDVGVLPEDVLRPEYWANIANMLKPGDRIEITAEDNAFFMEVLVLAVGKHRVNVVSLRLADLNEVKSSVEPELAEYKITWGGNTTKHRVIRVSDGVIVHQGSATKTDAEHWLRDYMKSLAA